MLTAIHGDNCMGRRYQYKGRNNQCGCIGYEVMQQVRCHDNHRNVNLLPLHHWLQLPLMLDKSKIQTLAHWYG